MYSSPLLPPFHPIGFRLCSHTSSWAKKYVIASHKWCNNEMILWLNWIYPSPCRRWRACRRIVNRIPVHWNSFFSFWFFFLLFLLASMNALITIDVASQCSCAGDTIDLMLMMMAMLMVMCNVSSYGDCMSSSSKIELRFFFYVIKFWMTHIEIEWSRLIGRKL